MLWGARFSGGGFESNNERENARPRRLIVLGALHRRRAVRVGPAWADKIKHPTAVFAGLDKITGRIISFEVAIDETVQFGSLQITPRVCYTRPPTEAPRTDVFVEVDEVTEKKTYDRLFTGWMFAASPGLHGIEHPVYDIWLTDCKGGTQIIHDAARRGGGARFRAARRRSGRIRRRDPKSRRRRRPKSANRRQSQSTRPPPPAPLDLNTNQPMHPRRRSAAASSGASFRPTRRRFRPAMSAQ